MATMRIVDPGRVEEGTRRAPSAAYRLVPKIRREPPLDLLDRLPFSARIARNLVLAYSSHREVARAGIREVQPADAGRRPHGGALGEIDADVARAEKVEQLELLAVIRTGGIAEGGPDPAMPLRDDVLDRRGIRDAPFAARGTVK